MISVYEKKENCSGCTACKFVCPVKAIEMKPDEEGFLYPSINQEICTDCDLCKKICAFQNGYEKSDNLETPFVYAVKHKNEEIRLTSTSGGAFTGISDFILESGGVVYGAAFDDNFRVIHNKASTKSERDKFKGSKYIQSDLLDTFLEIKTLLASDKTVLFSGTPCQTAGLGKFLEKVNTEKLFICDIVCHGVPSPLIWKDYLIYLENKYNSKLKQYNCRSKIFGWRKHTELVVFKNGATAYKSPNSQIHKNLFYTNKTLRPSCYKCKYTNFQRPSDFTIADFRGIERSLPEFDDDIGVSLVLVNTQKGFNLFERIKSNLIYKESNVQDCLQRNLEQPTSKPKNRELFWKDYQKYGFKHIAKKYGGLSLKSLIKRKIKSILYRIIPKH